MNFEEFVDWILGEDLDQLPIESLLEAVDEVLASLAENDPRYAWMVAIEEKLLEDVLPRERLKALAERFPPTPPDPGQQLERNLRSQIERVSAADGSSEALRELVRSIQLFDKDPRPLQEFLGRMEEQLTEFWTDYQSYPLGSDEIPAQVGEKLLGEAYGLWRSALQALSQERALQQGLDMAARANRILVVLQRMKAE